MSTTHKTSQNYKNEYNNLLEKENALKVRIANRLLKLCKQFPQAPIDFVDFKIHTIIFARSINNINYINDWIPIHKQFLYIELIEQYIADQQKIKQLEINF
jgi:hypothetical protein